MPRALIFGMWHHIVGVFLFLPLFNFQVINFVGGGGGGGGDRIYRYFEKV